MGIFIIHEFVTNSGFSSGNGQQTHLLDVQIQQLTDVKAPLASSQIYSYAIFMTID